MDENKKILDLKRKLLFDEETGMLREGIDYMSDYAKILYCEDEDELNEVILEIMKKRNEEGLDE